jgi:hypothetical protein
MKRRIMSNSKRLHIHAVPVVAILLAFTFLSGAIYTHDKARTAYGNLMGALFHRSFTVTTTADGKAHFALGQAQAAPQPIKPPTTSVTAQAGVTLLEQQAIDQAVSNSSY